MSAYLPKPCGFCAGKLLEEGACPVCLGKGEVQVRLPVHSCKRCDGTGRAIPNDPFLIVKAGHRVCSLCYGAGWLFALV